MAVDRTIMRRDWKCEICTADFARKGELTRHIKVHSGKKDFQCPYCGKAFIQRTGLNTHLNTHTGAKPYKCRDKDCNTRFGDPSSCTRHYKDLHMTPGKHFCPEPGCGSKIKRKAAFTAHLKKHGYDVSTLDIQGMIRPHTPGPFSRERSDESEIGPIRRNPRTRKTSSLNTAAAAESVDVKPSHLTESADVKPLQLAESVNTRVAEAPARVAGSGAMPGFYESVTIAPQPTFAPVPREAALTSGVYETRPPSYRPRGRFDATLFAIADAFNTNGRPWSAPAGQGVSSISPHMTYPIDSSYHYSPLLSSNSPSPVPPPFPDFSYFPNAGVPNNTRDELISPPPAYLSAASFPFSPGIYDFDGILLHDDKEVMSLDHFFAPAALAIANAY